MDGRPDTTPSAKSADDPSTTPRRVAPRDIVVIGGSAGALDAMLAAVTGFDAAFTGNVFIVSHIGANRSHLPELLSRTGALPAKHPENGEAIRPGIIYVAPPDRHLMVESGRIRLSRGPRQHFTRPAVDPLFRSAAEEYGARVIAVVLSGAGSDGAAGLDAIRAAGGLTVTQDPNSSLYPEMPRAAAASVRVDHVVATADMPALLRRLLSEPASATAPVPQPSTTMDERERPIALTCPECGGALREANSNGVKLYRCHTGHNFGPEEVLTGQVAAVDHAIEVAIRVLNERIELCRQMGDNARNAGRTMGVEHWRRLEKEAEDELVVLQDFLCRTPISASAEEAGPIMSNGGDASQAAKPRGE